MNFRAFSAALLACAFAASPSLAADGDAALQSALHADLAKYLAARAKAEHISALSLSINLKGATENINVAAGTTQWGGSVPVTPANLFQIGSNTKAFTAVTILQLEAEGKLTIEQTIGDWLPQYPAWKNVTIHRLLDMTSGIPEYDEVPALGAAMVKNPQHDFTPAELVGYVYPDHKGAPAATKGWAYSNTNYVLSEMIIEKVTGNSLRERNRAPVPERSQARRHVLPSRPVPPAILDRMVSGYFFNTDPGNEPFKPFLGRDVKSFSLSWARAAGGIVSTPEDVTYWSRRLYEGDLLAPKQRAELLSLVSMKTGKPIASSGPKEPRAFALGVAQSTIPGFGTFWFYEGETLGYRMIYFFVPKSDAVIAVGLNSQPDGKQDKGGPLLLTIYKTLHAAGKSKAFVRLDQTQIREILARTDIGTLIGGYVQLTKRGRDLVGLCPFHGEKTPSFHVHPDRGFFKCFGCGQGGDAIKFVQLLENVPFPDAARVLAKRVGIELEPETPAAARVRGEKEQIYAANDLAAAYFHRLLRLAPEAEGARAYCAKRGLTPATIESFKLGYAPPQWDGLVKELSASGVDLALAAKAGLVKQGQHGYYDFYRGRLMVPTYANTGEVVAFGGRALDDSEPKYLNTSTTPVYTKGRGLFALERARRAVGDSDALIVVEGYLDCIALHQAGFGNAVASLGTAFTPEQARSCGKSPSGSSSASTRTPPVELQPTSPSTC